MLSKIKKVEEIIFCLIILFLPTQLGFHFWPSFSYVYGLRIDYLSPTVYLTDVLIVLLFLTFLLRFFLSKQKIKFIWLKKNAWFLVFIFSLIGGVLISRSPLARAYGLAKFAEFIFFGAYSISVFKDKILFKKIIILLSIGVIFEGLLAIAQFFNSGSLGSILYFFGERAFNGQTPGIANASLAGQLILRPYATFPHPNVLAAFLLISLLFCFFIFTRALSIKEKIFFTTAIIIGSLSLVLTMSRVSLVVYLLLVIFLIFAKHQRKLVIFLIIIFIIIFLSPIKFRFFDLNLNDTAVIQRQELTVSSLLMVKDNFFLGVGINNFLGNLPFYKNMSSGFYLQPVHNIYLLVLAQTGIIGLIFFFWFLKKTFSFLLKKKSKIFILKILLLMSFLTLGLFDHYFLTLQQGQMLFALIFGFLWTDINSIS